MDGLKLLLVLGHTFMRTLKARQLTVPCVRMEAIERGSDERQISAKCHAPLCMRPLGNERKNCWEIWHETKRLHPRKNCCCKAVCENRRNNSIWGGRGREMIGTTVATIVNYYAIVRSGGNNVLPLASKLH